MEPGPSMNGWVNIRGLMNQIYQPDSDVNDSIRYYLTPARPVGFVAYRTGHSVACRIQAACG